MSKLSAEEKFIDLSDYGRPAASAIAGGFSKTSVTPVHVTLMFGVCGLFASWLIFQGYYATAGLFLILKSILDAADGELARVKNTPSYTGRYLDSVFDIILNFIILFTIQRVTGQPIWMMLLAFAAIQLQGTLYNYYYVILRQKSSGGDKTSRIFETETPTALPGEKQWSVTLLFKTYLFFYTLFDRIIYRLDRQASESHYFPKWFMSLLSLYGLGFQLLIMAVLLSLGFIHWILPFFIWYSVGIVIFIGIRKLFLK
ncbi:CDP-alcohol phosphatidyltransferase family protein [Rhodohalobacter sp.]|uniref:CDP-alcohol phosphatidyltransferase family protein n=1 Tax=Rhodohalobacter sp. TaxID=1974210 RepID=UPI002ACE7471|nr:CDP-alcohol phosphatidyltransferase family protein [Rhodohalobacter sp.]MDZ7756729.1 CDP-alcohol phosphatidyltransferase family protein [Rhodohalobacter sp.]